MVGSLVSAMFARACGVGPCKTWLGSVSATHRSGTTRADMRETLERESGGGLDIGEGAEVGDGEESFLFLSIHSVRLPSGESEQLGQSHGSHPGPWRNEELEHFPRESNPHPYPRST